jgi:acyl carrier protein
VYVITLRRLEPVNPDLITQLQDVFRTVFNREDLAIGPQSTARDVPGWDSLKHVELIVSVEERFGVKFKGYEIGRLQSVGDLLALLEQRMAK